MYTIHLQQPFALENGEILNNIQVGFHTYGTLNEAKDNVIWVCHALTANSDVLDWWSGLFGEGKCFDPADYFIVCVNALGSCYGTTGPSTPGENRRPLLDKFPAITTRDMARLHDEVRSILGIRQIKLLIGASLGGQQALEWAILNPDCIEHLSLIATNARHSAYGVAFNESQRLAIYADPTYGNGALSGGRNGLVAARSIALLSYRSYEGYVRTQTPEEEELTDHFPASSYQRYQGEKLAKRFDAYTYVTLSKAMDSHNVARGRESLETALLEVKAKTLVIGIGSDQLFPLVEQRYLADHIPNAVFSEISSAYGHDGFLLETLQLKARLNDFLYNQFKSFKPTVFKKILA